MPVTDNRVAVPSPDVELPCAIFAVASTNLLEPLAPAPALLVDPALEPVPPLVAEPALPALPLPLMPVPLLCCRQPATVTVCSELLRWSPVLGVV
jgi:hypothetical protein